jgi:toxin ParE1/3/4
VITVRLTLTAQRDLAQIRDFTTESWGAAQWRSYFLGLTHALETIEQNPNTGRPRDIIRTGLRSLSYESHLIFFRPVRHAGGAVVILRILHQRQNLAALQFMQDLVD